jgi:hypothetical protein
MKKIILLIPALAITLGAFGQGKAVQHPVSNAAPAHYPKQKTQAVLDSWAKQYPREVADYSEQLVQKMTKLDQSKPDQAQQYAQMKQEYNLLRQTADKVNGPSKAGSIK